MIKKNFPKLIFEVANVHGGNFSHFKKIIKLYNSIKYPNLFKNIKFQILKADDISTPEYHWYKAYKKLYFSPEQWKILIRKSKITTNIWLDLFDSYSVKILKENLKFIYGIKLQPSILQNENLFNSLKLLNLGRKKIMLNISGILYKDIETTIKRFKALNAEKIIIQFGFQSYPTKISDTNLKKISLLKEKFPKHEICMADHVDANNPFSLNAPVYSYLLGADYIEKHFCLKRKKSPFDKFSSLEPIEIKKFISMIKELDLALGKTFINESEKKYLTASIQKPVSAENLGKKTIVSDSDINFKRTEQKGLKLEEIKNYRKKRFLLSKEKKINKTFIKGDFKKSRVGILVTGRMKSSRLPQKALKKIDKFYSLELCLLNCKKVRDINKVALTTSYLEEDKILYEKFKKKFNVFLGHPDDVIKRFLGAAKKFKLDVVIRVTGDCPFVSPQIINYLMDEHFKNGADYTAAKKFSVGTSGEIYNVEALNRIIAKQKKALHSEYMPWYLLNNSEHFKINLVNLPKHLVRSHRLTLDYKEDLIMFNKLVKKSKKSANRISTEEIFNILDKNPKLSKINAKFKLIYLKKDFQKRLKKVTRFK
ncbi:MAG: hypothetical protein CMG02_00285 [Candidatus Marinimicrobia bacterium]|nr:hypothetical protein [Candidatus Neomarinimicrobiota bacterium]